jgi:SAM-dependent methyltransferase
VTPRPVLDPAIRGYYERRPEETRLQRGLSQLEAHRTRTLIERFAPPFPATVLDVGGAAGAYAGWLAEHGYDVHLVDPVPRLVDEARRHSASLTRPIASCDVGDARALAQPNDFAAMVLLLGPLYHLTTAADRALALGEAARVLAPGGVVFAAGITRWASAFDALARDLFVDPGIAAVVDQVLRDGQHRSTSEAPGYFTTAYFHRPEELRAEVSAAGLVVEGLFGLEGPCGLFGDFDARWADPRRRADMIRVAEAVEAEPWVLGVSGHFLCVARRPA